MPEQGGKHQKSFRVAGITLEDFIQETFRFEPIPLQVLRHGVSKIIPFGVGVTPFQEHFLAVTGRLGEKKPKEQKRPDTGVPSLRRQAVGPEEINGKQQVQGKKKRDRDGQKRPSTVLKKTMSTGENEKHFSNEK
jgi:hypothetical protein